MVVEGVEDAKQRICNIVQIAQRQIAFVELSVSKFMVNELSDENRNFIGAFIRQRSDCGLNHIRNHTDAGFAGLWSWSRVSVIFFPHAILLFLGALIKVFDAAGTVVRGNEVHDILR